jgi:diadenosine tetraphosphate (Ap4A) HIT family hydrolase
LDFDSMPMAGCAICQLLSNTPEHDYVVAQSGYWRITLAPDQFYVGRCYVTTLRHVPELSALSQEEWLDLHEVMRYLENSAKRELGATHVTWAALMNNAYQLPDPQPHVHWHVRPRYAERTIVGDVVMTDEHFGHHHQRDEHQKLLPYQMEAIVVNLRRSLPPPWWSTFR